MSDEYEKEISLYEAERNRAWHSWFANRGHIPPTDEHTLIFDGGFRSAWELFRARNAELEAQRIPDGYLTVHANASLAAACDTDTIRELLAERDALRAALIRILENEAPDWKFAEEFGGYVLDDGLREEAIAAYRKGGEV